MTKTNKQTNERTNVRTNEQTNKTSKWKNGWTNELKHKWKMNEQTNEQINKTWMNKRLKHKTTKWNMEKKECEAALSYKHKFPTTGGAPR